MEQTLSTSAVLECNICGCDNEFLGLLGYLVHVRCRGCHSVQAVDVEEFEDVMPGYLEELD